ncbi:MAG: fatty acyl-AMP ligase [Gammaproteobacteria bacterium]|nr:fatty acyl-AMP ligase [Gammaproteobacteria bacterium]
MQQSGNLVAALITRAECRPTDIAFSYLDEQCNIVHQLSNQQLHVRAAAIAGRLQQIVSPTDRVLLLFPQGLEFIYAFVGVMYSGAIPVITMPPPHDTQQSDNWVCHIKNIIEETGSNVVLTSESVLNDVVQYFFKSKTLSQKIFLSVEDINNDVMGDWSMPLIENNSIAYLQRTSAKKGNPKLVMISHYTMKNRHECITRNYQLTISSRSVSWLPHYHYLGLAFGILQPLYCGYRGYIYSQFDFYKNPHGWLDAITRHEVTFSGAPNFAYSMCIDQPLDPQQSLNLSRWNTAYNSGESVKKETMDKFFEKFSCCGMRESALTSIYGLAESTCVTSAKNHSENFSIVPHQSVQLAPETPIAIDNNLENNKNTKVISCGSAVLATRIAIVAPETQTTCDGLAVGEILVSSACNAVGYWSQPEETEKIFNVYLDNTGDGPYLRTGNLGFMKKGELYVVSRLKKHRKRIGQAVNTPLDRLENTRNLN